MAGKVTHKWAFKPGKRGADGSDKRVENAGPVGAHLDNDLQLGAVLAIAQDDQPRRGDPLGQHLVTQHKGGKRLQPRMQPRMQRGEDGFAGGGHGLLLSIHIKVSRSPCPESNSQCHSRPS